MRQKKRESRQKPLRAVVVPEVAQECSRSVEEDDDVGGGGGRAPDDCSVLIPPRTRSP